MKRSRGFPVVERSPIRYTPYGYCMINDADANVLKYNGERFDYASNAYLLGNGYRAYSPTLMRFRSPDNISPFGLGGINSYMYCGGDPINATDPTGHMRFGVRNSNIFEIFGGEAQMGGVDQSKALRNLKEISPGIYAATYISKKYKTKLLINGHGILHPDHLQKSVMAGANRSKSDYVDAAGLKKLIDAAGYKDYSEIRTMVCHSADGAESLGSSLASEAGVPVKAYKGVVTSYSSLYWIIKTLRKSFTLTGDYEVFVPHEEFIVKHVKQIRQSDKGKTDFEQYQPVRFT